MARPACARINLQAIRHNYQCAKQLAPQAHALAIIKANAYGHGAVAVAQALQAQVDGFGVACIEEALELREAGVQGRLVLLEGIFSPDEVALADQHQLTLTVHTIEQLQWLLDAKPKQTIDVLLKIDTGMHRLGFAPAQVKEVFYALQRCSHIGQVVLMSHFASADATQASTTSEQLHCFRHATQDLSAPLSLANSAATLAWPATHGDWLRPGIMLYGADPLDQPNAASQTLQTAMQLSSAVIAVHELATGECIGYGGRFQCEQPTKVAVVAIGYGDGYPRHAQDGTPIALNGQRTRLIGRVSMDMLTLDATGMAVKVGDPVELWGETVLANEVAAWADTIAYTLFTGITSRVSRYYHG